MRRSGLRGSPAGLPCLVLVCLGSVAVQGSCTHEETVPPSQEPPLAVGCNPLSGGPGEDCFTPFPSSFYLAADASGGTRLRIPDAVLPSTKKGVHVSPDPYNGRDGFSPATPMLAHFPIQAGRMDATNLPTAGRAGESLLPISPVQLFEYENGERVPILAEPDRNAGPDERQALIVYPQVRLRPGTRYVVAISGLSSESGQRIPPLAGFRALRDGRLDAGSLRSTLRAHYESLFAFLERQGLTRSSLQLAWDFQTASDRSQSGRLVRMRDTAFAYRGATGSTPAILLDKVDDKPPGRAEIWRKIQGRIQAPSFLSNDSAGQLLLGPDGEPAVRGFGQFPLTIHIPSCVERTMGPVPILLVGHSLFGSGQSELDSPLLRELGNRLCMVQVAIDWIGLSASDLSLVNERLPQDMNQLALLTDRLQQAQINVLYLARVLSTGGLDALPELRSMGRILADKSRVYYYGISNGGSLGLSLLALSPHIPRAALCVPGGFFSLLIGRSSAFKTFFERLADAYPDPLDRQIVIALGQMLWDASDPATYAPHVLRDPLPGVVPKRVLYQEGIGDAQVPNLATRAMVRSMGLSLLGLPSEAVFGVGQVLMSSESAYVQYDIGQQPRPGDSNVPPDRDNAVHRSIPRLEAAKAQLDAFLRTEGRVYDTCGPRSCSFPPP